MELKADFGHPLFEESMASALTTADLDDFYVKAAELERLNLFFVLEASFHKYLSEGKDELAARLAFLTAYYVFIPLTPPASWYLTLHYIHEAVRLDPRNKKYGEWLALIKKGISACAV